MKISVMGAGAIGGLLAGYLKLKGKDVSLVGRADTVEAIRNRGLFISGVRGDFNITLDVSDKLSGDSDLIVLAVKTQDIEEALRSNIGFLSGATILTTQNGIQADNLTAKYIPKENIISTIAMFGSTNLKPGEIVHNFEGSWVMGRIFGGHDAGLINASEAFSQIFPIVVTEDIKGMKYLKIFVNANNCIPAILGSSMQEAFLDVDISRISIAIWKEGLDIITGAGINLVSLPDFPLERLKKLASMPIDEAARIYSGIMLALSKEPLYGSILQSIKRGRLSEIDYINGEFVSLAKKNNLAAPLNEKLVEMVHAVERSSKFFSKDELINSTRIFIN